MKFGVGATCALDLGFCGHRRGGRIDPAIQAAIDGSFEELGQEATSLFQPCGTDFLSLVLLVGTIHLDGAPLRCHEDIRDGIQVRLRPKTCHEVLEQDFLFMMGLGRDVAALLDQMHVHAVFSEMALVEGVVVDGIGCGAETDCPSACALVASISV
jgi:hypothetical protein